ASCTLKVTFKPTATGTRTGVVTLTDNASSSPQTVSLTGTGVNPVPKLSALSPSSVTAGGTAFTLTVTGTNFVSTSTVEWNGYSWLTTKYVSGTQLTASVPAIDIATKGTATVTVVNPGPGGGTSSRLTFTIK
ncbi:MAG: IPT/TIG domain-containing protein, partial [Terriglobia bacterium]